MGCQYRILIRRLLGMGQHIIWPAIFPQVSADSYQPRKQHPSSSSLAQRESEGSRSPSLGFDGTFKSDIHSELNTILAMGCLKGHPISGIRS